VVLIAPAAADADLTISAYATSNVQLSGIDNCWFTAAGPTANVDVSDIDACLESGAPTSVTDNISGGGNLIIGAAISPSSCTNDLDIYFDDAVGSVTVNGAINVPG